jgi:16S rRNA (adenine1518-N6/adenine1519-N6)-dimethyltransferase
MKLEGRGMKNRDSTGSSREVNAPESVRANSSFILHPSSLPPKRRFGQNFLVDRGVVNKIINAVDPQSTDTIIEIGPGRGALTSQLIGKAGRVIAIEFDRDLIPELHKKFNEAENFQLVEADALAVDFCELIQRAETARVVANLPYNIGTAILQCLIDQRRCITEMTLMLQREVADRITAEPGSSERGFLSVLVEAYCEAERLFDVSPQSFRPAPKVWSSVMRLRVRPKIAAEVKDEKVLWQVVSAGFAHPRKTILNNLREAPEPIQELLKKRGGASIVLCDAGIPPLRRAETLAIEEWALLVNALV